MNRRRLYFTRHPFPSCLSEKKEEGSNHRFFLFKRKKGGKNKKGIVDG